MAWQHKSQLLQTETLRYFDKFDYPLTKKELDFWSGTKQYYHLPKRQNLIKLRAQREKYSLLKWGVAYKYASQLVKLPFIQAIFVTGSLAMNNCKKSDDIDFMIVTSPNTLWLTRFIVMMIFIKDRRFPGQRIAPDKICVNLWLDANNLKINDKSLYHAHEILQAKCIFDRGGVQYLFLRQNSWVKEYLPNVYKETFKNLKIKNWNLIKNYKLKIINYIFFVLQYLYMKPKMTTERVGLGYAFFHPAS